MVRLVVAITSTLLFNIECQKSIRLHRNRLVASHCQGLGLTNICRRTVSDIYGVVVDWLQS